MISCLWFFISRKAGYESLVGLSQSCRCSGTDRMFSISAAECEVLRDSFAEGVSASAVCWDGFAVGLCVNSRIALSLCLSWQ